MDDLNRLLILCLLIGLLYVLYKYQQNINTEINADESVDEPSKEEYNSKPKIAISSKKKQKKSKNIDNTKKSTNKIIKETPVDNDQYDNISVDSMSFDDNSLYKLDSLYDDNNESVGTASLSFLDNNTTYK